MAKAKDAFRTISEVADWLDTPTHVLRFWESKFSQIRPVKGAGGRRYYRPEDMELLAGIKQLLHEDGLTIKGTQKLLREKGAKHVATLGPSVNGPAVESANPAPDTAIADTHIDAAIASDDALTAVDLPQTPRESHRQDALSFGVSSPSPDEGPAQDSDATPDVAAQDAAATVPETPIAPDVADATPPPPETATPFQRDVPALPDEIPDLPARILGLAPADTAALRARAAEIAPLLARLEQLRDGMRHN
ncbi:MerR family transcriptional regulator [Yoonia sp.]|uniref:MerR family transcriptional regulator n=1 Tax=Yoonia sp. TaxID=2212373 RepID=UPI0025DADB7D|nr:MerR family transcriptional regulator [Yoonia sp.]